MSEQFTDSELRRAFAIVEDHKKRGDERISALTAKNAELKEQRDWREHHRQVAIEAEKKDAMRIFNALAAAHVCTPAETYGFNSSWAISDLIRAFQDARQSLARVEQENAELKLEVEFLTVNIEGSRNWAKVVGEERDALRTALKDVLTAGNKINMSASENRHAFDLAISAARAALDTGEEGTPPTS